MRIFSLRLAVRSRSCSLGVLVGALRGGKEIVATHYTEKRGLVEDLDKKLTGLGATHFPNLHQLTMAQLDALDDALEVAASGEDRPDRGAEIDPDVAAEHADNCALGTHCVHEYYSRRTGKWTAICCWCGDVFESEMTREHHGNYITPSEGGSTRFNFEAKLREGLNLLEAQLVAHVVYTLEIYPPGHFDGYEAPETWRARLLTAERVCDTTLMGAETLSDAVMTALEDPPGALVYPADLDTCPACLGPPGDDSRVVRSIRFCEACANKAEADFKG